MKNYFLVILTLTLISQTFAIKDLVPSDFSNYMNSTQPKVNLYQTLTKYYEKQLNQADQLALKETAQNYGTSPDTIQQILDWNLSQCTKILDKLKIKECKSTDKNTIFQCLAKCYDKVKEDFQQYKQTVTSKQIVDNALVGENVLCDWDTKNWPYDLIQDISNISDILFKEWVKDELKWWWKISMKQQTLKKAENILNPDNIFQDLLTNPTSSNKANKENKSTPNKDSWNISEEQINTSINTTQTNSSSPKSPQNPQIPQNQDFQIWNICSNSNSNTNSWTKIIETNSYNPIQWISQDNPLNPSNPNSTTFNVFDENWEKAQLLWKANSVANLLTNPLNWALNQVWQKIKDSLAWWKPVCWADDKKIISVCIQLIPSWPRWPVWWTIRVNSVEDIIKKIDDDLKDIKQSFIIPAWHGDEALDIDFKHIDFAWIMAFNIVLTKKPIFQYKRNNISDIPWKSDQWNEKDTQNCPNIPRFLGNMYTNAGIVNCNSSLTDTNKYLFTNIDNAKTPNWDFSKSYLWTDKTNTIKWQYDVENRIWEFVSLTTKFFWNLDKLLLDWQQASATLAEKSK